MAKTFCPPGVWTTLPDSGGDTLVQPHIGVYVCTDGTNPADYSQAYALGNGQDMVVAAGLAISIYPAAIVGANVTSIAV